MKKYGKYYQTTLHLDDVEHKQFIKTGIGVKKIFKTMLDALCPPLEFEEDKINKSGIMRNLPDDPRNVGEEEI